MFTSEVSCFPAAVPAYLWVEGVLSRLTIESAVHGLGQLLGGLCEGLSSISAVFYVGSQQPQLVREPFTEASPPLMRIMYIMLNSRTR